MLKGKDDAMISGLHALLTVASGMVMPGSVWVPRKKKEVRRTAIVIMVLYFDFNVLLDMLGRY